MLTKQPFPSWKVLNSCKARLWFVLSFAMLNNKFMTLSLGMRLIRSMTVIFFAIIITSVLELRGVLHVRVRSDWYLQLLFTRKCNLLSRGGAFVSYFKAPPWGPLGI